MNSIQSMQYFSFWENLIYETFLSHIRHTETPEMLNIPYRQCNYICEFPISEYIHFTSLFFRASGRYFSLQLYRILERVAIGSPWWARLATRVISSTDNSPVASGIKYDLKRPRGKIKSSTYVEVFNYLRG